MTSIGDKALEDSALQALYEISKLAADGRNEPARVARIACEYATDLIGLEAGAVFAWNDATGILEPVYETPSATREPAAAPGEGMVGEAFRRGEPVCTDDYQLYLGRVSDSAARGMRSAVAVPMVVDRRPIGVLGLWSYDVKRVSDRDVRLISLFATQIAPAFEAARSFTETRVRRDALEALQAVAVTISGVKDRAEVARRGAEIATELLNVDGARISWYDEESGHLRPLALHAPTQPRNDWEVEPGRGAVGIAFVSREPVVVEDYAEWPDALSESRAAGIRAIAAVPLVVRDRALGAISVTSTRPRHFGKRDMELLGLFASLLAADLEAAELIERSEQQVRDLTALQEIAVAASGVLDPAELAKLTVDTARSLLSVDSAVLRWWDPERDTLRLLATNDILTSHHEFEIPSDRGMIGAAFTTRTPQHVDHYAGAEQQLPGRAADGVKTALAVPLLVADRAVGAISVATYHPHRYDARARSLLGSFASLVGPALEAARLTAAQVQHEKELHTIYSAMACGVVVWDDEGRVMEINDTGLAMFELGREQLDGRMPADIAGYRRLTESGGVMRWEDRPMHVALRTGRPVRSSVVGYEKPGQQVLWLQFDCVPVLDGEGQVRRVIGSFIDISAVKSAEEARRESEAKSRFLASMSHELRTPLNSILGFTQLLHAETFGPLNERQRRYVGHITSSGQHLLELVNDVLDISKVAAGQMSFAAEAVDINAVVDEVIARVRPLAANRDLGVRRRLQRGVRARADRRRVEQVLHNLVSNAIKFTDEGGRISVEARGRRREVVLVVRDTGIGIPPDQVDRIFEEFTQVDDSRRRRAEGTGLGLALSRRLAEEMGGRLWVKSVPGAGSTFYFALPAY